MRDGRHVALRAWTQRGLKGLVAQGYTRRMLRTVPPFVCLLALLFGCGPQSGSVEQPGDEETAGEVGEAEGSLTATGFWRLKRAAQAPVSERDWLVSPAGRRTFVLGLNTVMRDASCDGIAGYIRRTGPTAAANIEWARLSTGQSGGHTVPSPFRFNSVGAFSDQNDFDSTGGTSYMVRARANGGAEAPYAAVVYPVPRATNRALKDESGAVLTSGYSDRRVGDPFNPAFLADLDAIAAAEIHPYRADPNLIAWYAGNEQGMFDSVGGAGGVRDFRAWIWSDVPAGSSIDAPKCARHALAAFLRQRYGAIAALNQAWESAHAGFAAIVEAGPKPVPYVHDCNLACRSDLQRFVHDRLLKEWVRVVTTRFRAADPNHLLGSTRLALADSTKYRFYAPADSALPDKWADSGRPLPNDSSDVRYGPYDVLARDGSAGFDFVAVNVYDGDATLQSPWFPDGIHKLSALSGLPVMISEFSIRARVPGWTNKGGAGAFVSSADAVEDQLQRGRSYRSQIEQFASFRRILGANFHAWSDRFLAADGAHQINMGLVQCDDPARGLAAGARWSNAVQPISDTNRNILAILEARTGL